MEVLQIFLVARDMADKPINKSIKVEKVLDNFQFCKKGQSKERFYLRNIYKLFKKGEKKYSLGKKFSSKIIVLKLFWSDLWTRKLRKQLTKRKKQSVSRSYTLYFKALQILKKIFTKKLLHVRVTTSSCTFNIIDICYSRHHRTC